jgi:hypothetical protein
MKRLALLFTLFCPALLAQTPVIQKTHCAAVTTCSLPKPLQAGDTLVVIVNPMTTVADAANDAFVPVAFRGWYGNVASVAYAVNAQGSGTVTFGGTVTDAYVAEYPPATFDQDLPKQAVDCCHSPFQLGPLTVGQQDFLIAAAVMPIGKTATLNVTAPATMEDTGTSISVADEIAAPGNASLTVSWSGPAWGAQLLAFKMAAQPQPYVLTLNGITFTFPMQMPPVCSASNAPCSMQIQLLDGNGNQLALGQAGQINLIMTWSPNGNQQTTVVPVVTAVPASQ